MSALAKFLAKKEKKGLGDVAKEAFGKAKEAGAKFGAKAKETAKKGKSLVEKNPKKSAAIAGAGAAALGIGSAAAMKDEKKKKRAYMDED